MTYSAFILDATGHVIYASVLPATDDKAAIDAARELVGQNDVEIWHLDRKVAKLSLVGPGVT